MSFATEIPGFLRGFVWGISSGVVCYLSTIGVMAAVAAALGTGIPVTGFTIAVWLGAAASFVGYMLLGARPLRENAESYWNAHPRRQFVVWTAFMAIWVFSLFGANVLAFATDLSEYHDVINVGLAAALLAFALVVRAYKPKTEARA